MTYTQALLLRPGHVVQSLKDHSEGRVTEVDIGSAVRVKWSGDNRQDWFFLNEAVELLLMKGDAR